VLMSIDKIEKYGWKPRLNSNQAVSKTVKEIISP
jgi:hypothetical protein